ncbi:muconolactone Delta-isomerase [Nocardioides sp. GY 10127]|uniref:muconolactone Delta-isomerase n=1 Tax=Nocardioides sp. GY 10127 TaxID=2569762 RepID=UPI0010A8040D|nr:muconolactone Delta-isomerase [Nocardioides sp. GY 10127]TIC82621.1 muconolactone Delta-isomerase [Nocardioides sp. GY 10127]
MLFAVTMTVNIPHDLDPEVRADTVAREKAYAQELQRAGTWRHLWRIAGTYSNLSVFDVPDGDALNDVIWGLPLFPYMDIEVTALATHPSAI